MNKRPYHILLVDDEPAIVKMMTKRLESEGFEVLTAGDGIEAMEKVTSLFPDLIILDVMLPKLDGYAVCRSLKAGSLKNIPIIMLSARSQDKDEKIGLSCGADIYVKKPFRSEELIEKIRTLILSSSLSRSAD